jgi:hypothetical protein
MPRSTVMPNPSPDSDAGGRPISKTADRKDGWRVEAIDHEPMTNEERRAAVRALAAVIGAWLHQRRHHTA